jgi:hypothetical protein
MFDWGVLLVPSSIMVRLDAQHEKFVSTLDEMKARNAWCFRSQGEDRATRVSLGFIGITHTQLTHILTQSGFEKELLYLVSSIATQLHEMRGC